MKERRDLTIAQLCIAYINFLYLERAIFSGLLESHIIAEIKRTKIGCVEQVSHMKLVWFCFYFAVVVVFVVVVVVVFIFVFVVVVVAAVAVVVFSRVTM
jgi:hypothetical protein